MKDREDYLHKIFRHYWQKSLDGRLQCYFVSVADAGPFSGFLDRFLSSTIGEELRTRNAVVFRSVLAEGEFREPYDPFLGMIRSVYRDKDPAAAEKSVDSSGVYHFQKEIFTDYLLGREPVERREEIIPFAGEIDYEKKRVLESLWSLFQHHAGGRPLVLVVENLHYAQESVLEFVRFLAAKDSRRPVFLVFAFDRDRKFADAETESAWKTFVHSLEEQFTILDYHAVAGMNAESAAAPGVVPQPPREFRTAAALIRLARDHYQFCAYPECRSAVLRAYHMVTGGETLTDRENLLLFHTLGDVHTCLDEQDFALIYYNQLLNTVQEMNNAKEILDANRKIALAYLRRGNTESALKYARQAWQVELKPGNEQLVARCHLLELFFNDSDLVRENVELYGKLVPLYRKLDLMNMLTILYTNGAYLLALSDAGRQAEAFQLCETGIEMSEAFGNEYRLSIAFHSLALLHQAAGDNRKALLSYKKSERLRIKLGNRIELIKICNGIGYFCYTVEDYRNSLAYFSKALKLLEGENDYQEICLTIFNIAMVFFFARDYRASLKYLEDVLFLMNQLKIERLPYHAKDHLYPYFGIAFLKQKELNRAVEYYNRCRARTEPKTPDRLYGLLFGVLEALIAAESQQYDEAVAGLDRVAARSGGADGANLLPSVLYEKGLVLRQKGDETAAAEVFRAALEKCPESRCPYTRKLLTQALAGKAGEPKPGALKAGSFNVQAVIRNARQEINLNKLHKKIDEMNFLNGLQNVLAQCAEKETLVYESMYLVNSAFLVDVSFLYLLENGEWVPRYLSRMPDDLDFDPQALVGELAREPKDLLAADCSAVPGLKGVCGSVHSLVSLPIRANQRVLGVMVLASLKKENTYTEDDLSALSIVSRQLAIALERIELMAAQKEQLDYINRANVELAKRNEQFEKELSMARRVQESMIESSLKLPQVPEMSIAAKFLFMESVGGDIFDMVHLGKNMYGFFIGDVSGHGVAASLITAMVKVTFSSYAKFGVNTGEVLKLVNREICKFISDLDYYVAAYYAVLDLDTGMLQYSNAGHHSAILYRREKGDIQNLDANGFVIGFLDDVQYDSISVRLKEGDRILFLTDGIIEARTPDGKFYEDKRLEDFILKNTALPPQEFVEKLFRDVEAFCGGASQKDDRAVLCVDYKKTAGNG